MNPTLAGFLAFVLAQGVPASALPADQIDDPDIVTAFNLAIEIVSLVLQQVAPTLYALAVYNFAMHTLVEIAQDQPGQYYFGGTPKGVQPAVEGLRGTFNIYGGIFGTVTTTSDEGTSVSVEAPDFVKTLSLSDLQLLKTPWGRQYVALAQRCGLNWGLD